MLAEKDAQLAAQLAEKDAQLAEKDAQLAEDAQLAAQLAEDAQLAAQLAEKDAQVAEKDEEVNALKSRTLCISPSCSQCCHLISIITALKSRIAT